VIAGQFLELWVVDRPAITEEEARRIAVLKSGRYSVREPLLVGALLADAGDDLVRGLADAGEALGEAFQLADDLLGTFGDRRATGKPVDSDIRAGKKNVLYAKTVELLDDGDRGSFVEAWGGGDGMTEAEVTRVRDLVESSGARAATERLLEGLVGSARTVIEGLDIDPPSRDALLELAARSTRRDS
jgi:geranylgeranyl diphosphate synthase type I